MDTDRQASDGDAPHDGPASPSSASPATGDDPAPTTESGPAPEGTAHDYGYGADGLDAAGTDGPRAADSSTADVSGTAEGPMAATGADPATGTFPATSIDPETGLRTGTAPRAVLRPIPEGFPTPPPRPARPNRRPAPKPDPSTAPARPRRLLIAGIAAAAVLLLVVVVGGGLLAVRHLSPEEPAPVAGDDPGTQAPAAPAGQGAVEVGGVTFTEVSTEVGVRAVGSSSSRVEPEGEFVVVVFAVENPTSAPVRITSDAVLEAADETFPVDDDATHAYETDSEYAGVVPTEGTVEFHAVFDVPIGTDPSALRIELPDLGEIGALPLGG